MSTVLYEDNNFNVTKVSAGRGLGIVYQLTTTDCRYIQLTPHAVFELLRILNEEFGINNSIGLMI